MREGAKISNDMIQFTTIESLAIRIFLKKKFIDRLLSGAKWGNRKKIGSVVSQILRS